jgi:hypothetical protein
MAEFLGYAGRPEPVSWLKIATKGIENIDAIEADRQKQREALEKSADDLVAASKEYKPGQSGSLNNLVLQGADRVRNTTLDLKKQLMNGQLTPTEYKSRVAKMSEDWKYFGEFAKSYNDIINKGVEYLNDPKASKLGEYFVDKQSKLADVANKQIVVDPSSYNVVMSDPDSGMIVDFKSSLIPENQRPLRLDVINEVERFTKGLGETSRYVNGVWTTSPILKDANEYQKAKANFTKSMLQSSRGAASILSDYVGGYDFYETAQQKKEIEAAGGKAIQLVQGPNGIVTPKLTAAQEKEARDVLDRLVDSRVDVEREQPRPVERTVSNTSGSGSGGGASNQSLIMDYAEYGAQNPVFATAILKARPMPDDPSAFVEKVELGSDGRYRFYTYGFDQPSEMEKKKGVRPKATKSIVTKAVNKEAASSIMARMLENSQSVNKNEAWNQGITPEQYDVSYVRGRQTYRPTQNTSSSAISGGNVR